MQLSRRRVSKAIIAGNALKALFNRNVSALARVGEVALFRAMCTAIGNWRVPNVVETREYHGRRHQVEHQTRSPVARLRKKWCELCDVVLVTYDVRERDVRLTFLQAKHERSYQPHTGAGLAANMVQWSLLGTRAPIIGYARTFRPPPPRDLLSSAILPSVGSFGFFYPTHGSIELAYASADLLNVRVPKRPLAHSKYGRLAFPVRSRRPCW